MKFYICRHCGNIITKLTSSKVPVHCCGEPMELLEAGVTDAAVEKHVPAVFVSDGRVTVEVGTVAHPMTAEHFIQWVAVETERDALVHWFHPGEEPRTEFALTDGSQVSGVGLLQPPRPLEERGLSHRRHKKAARITAPLFYFPPSSISTAPYTTAALVPNTMTGPATWNIREAMPVI